MSDSEDDYNPRAHTTLLQAISGLKKTQHIRQSTRNEPKIKQDEFELVKGSSVVDTEHADAPAATAVGVNDLVQVLHKKKKHIDAGKLLRNVHRSKKIFQKPLEKPAAQRIKRQIGYEKVKSKLERWDAVVSKNRAAETQVFPLVAETVYINTSLNAKPLKNSIKSDLRREMELAEEKLRQLKRQREGDTEDETALENRQRELHEIKLTREELIARRKELAYLKMRESQQSAKARLRNKIKSKKYHKLLRKQKIQEQLKEFEQLQKTDPEAALEKLNDLEKSRVLERATLRHKNTGAWAKNLQVRAKYDKDVRKDLAEQLQVSRELSQKSKAIDSGESEDEIGGADSPIMRTETDVNDVVYNDPSNPWFTTTRKTSAANKSSAQEHDENWRKYWMERNENEKLLDAYKNDLNLAKMQNESDDIIKQEERVVVKQEKISHTQKPSKRKITQSGKDLNLEAKLSKLSKKRAKYENGWLVEEIDPAEIAEPLQDIDDLFDEVEDHIEARVQEKLKKLSEEAKSLNVPRKTGKLPNKEHDELKHLKDLSFKEKPKYPTLDEELGEEINAPNVKPTISSSKTTPTTNKDQPTKLISTANDSTPQGNVDPTSFPTVTIKQPHFNTLAEAIDANIIGEADILEDDGVAQSHLMTISEAFEDDDIVADFGQEKAKDSELKNTEIELTMPGWGSWAGAGIDESTTRRPNKRIVLKLAPKEKRRDENKDAVYINEESSKHLRPHLVSDLPFPFTSLQDYEASIRAPIGRNYVPETAFRMLTRPSVITRKGAIIEPMDEKELSKRPQRPRNVIESRIQKLSKEVQAVK